MVSTTGDELLLYRTVSSEGNIEDLGLTVRDIVTVVGKRSSYNGVPQMAQGGVLESYEHYEGKSIPEFLALTTSDTNLYTVYGKIVEVKDLSESYNNVSLTIEDEEGNQLYIYRCKAYDGINVATVNPEVGGYVAVCGKYGEYKGAKQMASGGLILNYYKPEAGTDPDPEPGTDPEPGVEPVTITMSDYFTEATSFVVGSSYQMGDLTCEYVQKGGSTTSNYNANDPGIRFYANDVIKFTSAKDILRMEFVAYGGKEGPITSDVGSFEGLVWTGNAKEITFTATAQCRFNAIKVTFAE